jgi:hypothetical protein
MARRVTLTATEESLLTAAHLSAALRRGWHPPRLPPPIQMYEGEYLYAHVAASLAQHTGATVGYTESTWIIGGSIPMLAASAGASALMNSSRRKAAARAAAPQWRVIDSGYAYLTNLRLAGQFASGWNDFWFEPLRASECTLDGVILWYDGMPPCKIAVPHPEWLFSLFRWLVYGEIFDWQLDERTRERVVRAGHPLPDTQSTAPSGPELPRPHE